MRPWPATSEKMYPETAAGGYSRVDGTVAFYCRVNALLSPAMTVMDFGAGRGAAAIEDPVMYRRRLQILRGKVSEVIGVDIDAAVRGNPAVDRSIVVSGSEPLPLDDESVDLIVSDFCLEHVEDPHVVSGELGRVLKAGGWICARTPNRWGYISLSARLIPNRWHSVALRALQPGRQAMDVFPTHYRLNTVKDLRKHFPSPLFRYHGYGHSGPPAYFGSHVWAMRAVGAIQRHAPECLSPVLFVFIQKSHERPPS